MIAGIADQACAKAPGIYVASRASIPARGEMWRALRSAGVPITSTWIDEDGEGETADWSELWQRIEGEIKASRALILYAEPDDFPLKGAFVEAGMALASGIPVYVVAPGVEHGTYGCRPIGSWASHPLVQYVDTVEGALANISYRRLAEGLFYGAPGIARRSSFDSSAWTGRPSTVIRDQYGVSDWDWHLMRQDYRRRWVRDRIEALGALWLPAIRHRPRDARKGWTVYDGHERNRGEEWTFWRAVRATIAIVTGRDHTQAQVDLHGSQDSFDMGYFDARSTYGGYDVMVISLYPRCRVSIFSDGESLM